MKDRDAEHQRWADRQQVTADVLRQTVEAAGARAAEISEWLDSSLVPEDADVVPRATTKPVPLATRELLEPVDLDKTMMKRVPSSVESEQVPSGTHSQDA